MFGSNRGKSSKSMVNLPCSPHPADGVAVAEWGGNGLLKLGDEVVRVACEVDVALLAAVELVEP